MSVDDDHVIRDLGERFDEILEALEATDGWVTARVQHPVLILGSLEGVETGIRQLIRQRPLEVEEVATRSGTIRVATLREMARIKAWLILQRSATSDYLAFAALADRLGPDAPWAVIEMDDYHVDQRGPGGRRIATQVAKQLSEPAPYDVSEIDVRHYRSLLPRWQEWAEVLSVCRQVAVAVLAEAVSPAVATTMIHRHLDYAKSTPPIQLGPAAIDDLLDRGDLDDWAPLARRVAEEPWGPPSDMILRICADHAMYGTSRLWTAYVAACRAAVLGCGGASWPTSPRTATLPELRMARGLSQAAVGAHLGMNQSEVSRLERRRDIRLSTLRSFVEAVGGRLRMVVTWPASARQVDVAVGSSDHVESRDVAG